MMDEAVWTTREGEKIPVSKMETRHLSNAMPFAHRCVRRELHRAELAAMAYACTAPDGAADCADREAEGLMHMACEPLSIVLIEDLRYMKPPTWETPHVLVAMWDELKSRNPDS